MLGNDRFVPLKKLCQLIQRQPNHLPFQPNLQTRPAILGLIEDQCGQIGVGLTQGNEK
jgi:hypothetical protein